MSSESLNVVVVKGPTDPEVVRTFAVRVRVSTVPVKPRVMHVRVTSETSEPVEIRPIVRVIPETD
jgi:hypothetical protein